jgi:predicted RNA-binding protein with PIN domain
MPDATLYLFDGYNLLHAADLADRTALVDRLASFVAMSGARGVVVFDGAGDDVDHGALSVRFAPDADAEIERLAARFRRRERVLVVSSDTTLTATVGREVAALSAQTFLHDLPPATHPAAPAGGLGDRVDAETRARLERLRRGE